jgi:hypothetical protein
LILLVDHHRHVVGGMQINCSVQFHLGSSFEWVWGWLPARYGLSKEPAR